MTTLKITILTGDITKISADVIVNAANSSLMGGGGVDGAIHRAGGNAILQACKELRRTTWPSGLPTGEAVATTAGELPARWVIHTVGPVWRGGNAHEEELLYTAYKNCIRLAESLGAQVIAFPAISTGIYGFPRERAAAIVGRCIREAAKESLLTEIIFVFFSLEDCDIFRKNCGL